jgi:hypothetical protein
VLWLRLCCVDSKLVGELLVSRLQACHLREKPAVRSAMAASATAAAERVVSSSIIAASSSIIIASRSAAMVSRSIANLCVLGRQRTRIGGPVLTAETIRYNRVRTHFVFQWYRLRRPSPRAAQDCKARRQHFTWPGRDWCVDDPIERQNMYRDAVHAASATTDKW